VIVEVDDGIILKPVKRKIDPEKLREVFKRHVESLKRIKGRKEPKPGKLAKSSLEEEFDDESIY
jgi:antitoxin PrlF